MLTQLFKYWRSHDPSNLDSFQKLIEADYLKGVMEKVFDKMHKIEVEEFCQMIQILVKERGEVTQMIYAFVKDKIEGSVKKKMPKQVLSNLLSLARAYIPEDSLQEMLNLLISTV